jgi:hypothetical protein
MKTTQRSRTPAEHAQITTSQTSSSSDLTPSSKPPPRRQSARTDAARAPQKRPARSPQRLCPPQSHSHARSSRRPLPLPARTPSRATLARACACGRGRRRGRVVRSTLRGAPGAALPPVPSPRGPGRRPTNDDEAHDDDDEAHDPSGRGHGLQHVRVHARPGNPFGVA